MPLLWKYARKKEKKETMKTKMGNKQSKEYVNKSLRFSKAKWGEIEILMANEGYTMFNTWINKVLEQRKSLQASQRAIITFIKPLLDAVGLEPKMLLEGENR